MSTPERFVSTTTIHGLQNIADSKSKVERASWAITVALLASYMCFQVTKATVTYLKYDTVVALRVVSLERLPNLTICPDSIKDLNLNLTKGSNVGLLYLSGILDRDQIGIHLENVSQAESEARRLVSVENGDWAALLRSTLPPLDQVGGQIYVVAEGSIVSERVSVRATRMLRSSHGLCWHADGLPRNELPAREAAVQSYTLKLWLSKQLVNQIQGVSVTLSFPLSGAKRTWTYGLARVEVSVSLMELRHMTGCTKGGPSRHDCSMGADRLARKECNLCSRISGDDLGEHYGPYDSYCNRHKLSRQSFGTCLGEKSQKLRGSCRVPCRELIVELSEKRDNSRDGFWVKFVNPNRVLVYERVLSYTWDSYLGDIGGYFGFFMGISVLSLIHLVSFLVRTALDVFNKDMKVQPTHGNQNGISQLDKATET